MSGGGVCRRCKASMRWVRMAKSGKANPLNPDVDRERGNVLIDAAGWGWAYADSDEARGVLLTKPEGWEGPFLSHFVTCPARAEFRREAAA